MTNKIKFMLLLSFILSIGFISTSMVGYFVARDSLTQQISSDTLPLISDNIYSEIQRDLLKPILISSLMANDTFLKDWAANGEQSPEKIINYLEKIQTSYDTVTSFFISDDSLKYYHSSGVLKTISKDDAADQWYFRAKEMDASHELNIDFDISLGNSLTVFINYKVFDIQGKFIGITGVGLSLSKVQTIIQDYQTRYSGDIFFVDQNANVTLKSVSLKEELDLEKTIDEISVKTHILGYQNTSFSYVQDGHKVLFDSRYLEELHWYLIVRKSDKNLNIELYDSLKLNLLISLIITLMVLIICWYTLSGYQKRLEIMATTDKLTGLNNRQMFDPIFEERFKYSARHNTALSVVIIDIDDFKTINDQYGHPFGDKVLIKVAELIKQSTRDSDILCRWGGEEFIIAMPNCNAKEAQHFSEKLQQKFAQASFTFSERTVDVQLSIGLSEKINIDQSNHLIFRADQALLSAKKSGKNRVTIG